MKVLVISHSDFRGGASIAAFRLCEALLKIGISTKMLVLEKGTDADFVEKVKFGFIEKIQYRLGLKVLKWLSKGESACSFNLLPTPMLQYINSADADIVNIHWINKETISLNQIKKIKKKVVFTLHDMWWFCGIEHCSSSQQYLKGFANAPLFIERLVWKNKKALFHKKYQLIVPSRWLKECATSSDLFKDLPIEIIGNTLNTESFQRRDQKISRKKLGLSDEGILIGFGSWGKKIPDYKGFDILQAAFPNLKFQVPQLKCVVLGSHLDEAVDKDFISIGHVKDHNELSNVLSALDVLVVPSRIDAFNQLASESLACGTPVVAFKGTGVDDVVAHKETGYLAEPFSGESLCEGILWVIKNKKEININCRERVINNWDYPVVASKYLNTFKSIIRR